MKNNLQSREALLTQYLAYGAPNAHFGVLFGERRYNKYGNPTQLVKVLLFSTSSEFPADVTRLLSEVCGLYFYKKSNDVGIEGYADEIETVTQYLSEALCTKASLLSVRKIR